MRTDQLASEAKRFGVYHCRADDSLLQASRQMVEEDISALVVLSEYESLAGILTRTDLMRTYLETDAWEDLPVSRAMSTDVVTVRPNARLDTVAQLMLEHHIHRIVIAQDDGGKMVPISVISDADIVYHMVKNSAG